MSLPLKFDYRAMAIIRKLALDKRYEIWMERYAKNATRKLRNNPEQMQKAYKEIVENDRNEWSEIGQLNRIIDECNFVEESLQSNIYGSVICPVCTREVHIIHKESNFNKDFLHLPRWRELSCYHFINPFGKALTEEKVEEYKKEEREYIEKEVANKVSVTVNVKPKV